MTVNPDACQKVIDRWRQLPVEYDEASLDSDLGKFLFEKGLGIDFQRLKQSKSLGSGAGLKPDWLVFGEKPNQPPILVVENKRREPGLSEVPEAEFEQECRKNELYKRAIGCAGNKKENGIKQYLDRSNPRIQPELLASYGLVFNGDKSLTKN